MKKLFIHIGTHKTGTTVFQETLMQLKNELINTDRLMWARKGCFSHYRRLENIITYDTKLEEEFHGFIKELTNNGSQFIISAEGLSGTKRGNVYSNTDIIAKTLKAASAGIETHILVMVRRQDEFIQSLFTQKRHLGESMNLNEFISNIELDYLDWNNFLEPWIECFGKSNVHVLPYDRAVFSKYSVVSLLNTVINSTVLAKLDHDDVVNKNVGYSAASSAIAERINPELTVSQKKILRRVLQKVGNKGVLEEYNILPKEEKQKLVDYFYESNAVLARKYFLKPFGMSNFSDPVFVQNNQLSETEVLNRTVVELINILESEQEKTKQFPVNVILRIYRRLQRVLNH